ncbi:MAG: hypothetical protein U1F77_04265 [Kiritimatiellia bacterium]
MFFTGSGALSVVDTSGDANNRQLLVTGNSPSFSGAIGIGNGTANSGWLQVRSTPPARSAAAPSPSTPAGSSPDGGRPVPPNWATRWSSMAETLMSQSYSVNFTGAVTVAAATTQPYLSSSAANVVVGGERRRHAAGGGGDSFR